VCVPLLLERPLLFLELLLELRVGSLEVLHVVLQEPCLSSPFLLQLVELPLQIQVLRLLIVDALFQSSEFLVTTHNCPQFFLFLLRVSDHILHKREDRVKTIRQSIQADKFSGLTMAKSYSSL
jgi:hypothetical protein